MSLSAALTGLLTYFLSLVAYFGFRFLTLYYQHFGHSLQKVNRSAEHIFVRGIDVVFLDIVVLVLSVAAFLFIYFLRLNVRYRQANGREFSLTAPALLLIAGCLYLAHERTEVVAEQRYLRDIDPLTTTLQRLVCLDSKNDAAQGWFDSALSGERIVLVLDHSGDEMAAFFAPPILVGLPRVELFYVDLQGSGILTLARSASRGAVSSRSNFCVS